MISDPPSPKRRWSRSQRFSLSEKGIAAEQAYRDVIVASRHSEGRASFDAARTAWAASHAADPEDGVYLGELRRTGPTTLQALVTALEDCEKSRAETLSALERLVTLGLVSADAPPAAAT